MGGSSGKETSGDTWPRLGVLETGLMLLLGSVLVLEELLREIEGLFWLVLGTVLREVELRKLPVFELVEFVVFDIFEVDWEVLFTVFWETEASATWLGGEDETFF